MTATIRHAAAVLAAVLAIFLTAVPAAAHAELTKADPTDGSEVPGPFAGPITLQFSEDLAPNSNAVLKDGAGDEVATAEYSADAPDELVIELSTPLPADAYRIEIAAIGDDGHIERPVVEFTVVEPAPTPSPPAQSTDGPSPALSPSGSAAPSPSPAPSADGTPATSTADLLFPILAALIAVAVLGWVLLRNRRAAR